MFEYILVIFANVFERFLEVLGEEDVKENKKHERHVKIQASILFTHCSTGWRRLSNISGIDIFGTFWASYGRIRMKSRKAKQK